MCHVEAHVLGCSYSQDRDGMAFRSDIKYKKYNPVNESASNEHVAFFHTQDVGEDSILIRDISFPRLFYAYEFNLSEL